jgi:GntR family transcriptional regulator
MNKVSKSSSIPQYIQIQEKLKQFIQIGRFRLGGKLPSENVLASQFGVSRMTVRHALDKLVQENIIEKRRGLGSFVTNKSDAISAELSFPPSLTKLLNEAGFPPSSKILTCRLTRKIPSRGKELLKLKPNEQVAFLERLRFGADIPLAINQSWLPDKLVGGITEKNLIEDSLMKTLIENYHILPTKGIEWVEPTVASTKEAELLKIKPGSPLLLMTMASFMEDGTPVEFSKTLWRGDKLRLQINSRNFEITFR